MSRSIFISKSADHLRRLWAGDPDAPEETTAEFIQSMAAMLVVGLFLVTFNLQAFEIPSGSMIGTLLIGDHVLVDRITAAPPTSWVGPLIPYSEVKRGDIIVFIHPAQPGLHVVKRIIGIPGDHLHLKDGVVYRNGVRLDESYVQRNGNYFSYKDEFPSVPAIGMPSVTDMWQVELPSHIENGDLVVPPGKYFGMGDNRDISLDSRYWGFIPRENIIGRPMFIYWSFITPEHQYEETSIGARAKFLGHIIMHFFTETRWRRTIQYVL